MLVADWFDIRSEKPTDGAVRGEDTRAGTSPPKTQENPLLSFQLKDLDGSHPYLAERGLAQETMKAFQEQSPESVR